MHTVYFRNLHSWNLQNFLCRLLWSMLSKAAFPLIVWPFSLPRGSEKQMQVAWPPSSPIWTSYRKGVEAENPHRKTNNSKVAAGMQKGVNISKICTYISINLSDSLVKQCLFLPLCQHTSWWCHNNFRLGMHKDISITGHLPNCLEVNGRDEVTGYSCCELVQKLIF